MTFFPHASAWAVAGRSPVLKEMWEPWSIANKEGMTFEVEFVTGEGATLAVLTLSQHDIRPMHAREILHVSALAETESAD